MISAPRLFLRRLPALIASCLLTALEAASAETTLAAAKPDAVVAPDGTGDYTSLQEAISKAPMRTGRDDPRWVIRAKPGTYRERIHVQRERGNILVRGDDAATTIITFDMHANMTGGDGKPIGTFRTPTLWLDGDGMIWEDITIANGAGPVAQALAIRVDADRAVFRRCRFLGWQDTILVNRGRHYFEDCYVEGHVDFIFGGATAYFNRCHIHCLKDGYITAASTPDGAAHGLVFADCRITGVEGVKTYLGRPWRDFAKTVFIRTEISDAIRAEGWHNWNRPHAESTVYYAEHASISRGADPGKRVAWAKTLTAAEAAGFTPEAVLGGDDGWNPVADRAPVKIVLVGDSTVTDHAGWGAGFRGFVGEGAMVRNAAMGGRSSRNFISEGHWERALAQRGDYYLIQFGHNDQPGKGPERETDPASSYREFMARYVDEVRSIGGKPVLVTSLVRRNFSKTDPARIDDTLAPWADAVRKLAAEKNVPLIDLNASSLAYCERIGPEGCARLDPIKEGGKRDTTHIQGEGSVVFARLVVDELRTAVPELAHVVRPSAGTD